MSTRLPYSTYFAALLLLLALASPVFAQENADTENPEIAELGMETKSVNKIAENMKRKPLQEMSKHTTDEVPQQLGIRGIEKPVYGIGGDGKPLYDTQEYTRDLPLYDTQKYSRDLPLRNTQKYPEGRTTYDTQEYTRDLPLRNTQKYPEGRTTYDTQEYTRNLTLYEIQSKIKSLNELGMKKKGIYEI